MCIHRKFFDDKSTCLCVEHTENGWKKKITVNELLNYSQSFGMKRSQRRRSRSTGKKDENIQFFSLFIIKVFFLFAFEKYYIIFMVEWWKKSEKELLMALQTTCYRK
jgi:hypothetical protein